MALEINKKKTDISTGGKMCAQENGKESTTTLATLRNICHVLS